MGVSTVYSQFAILPHLDPLPLGEGDLRRSLLTGISAVGPYGLLGVIHSVNPVIPVLPEFPDRVGEDAFGEAQVSRGGLLTRPDDGNQRVLGGLVLDVCVVGASHQRPGCYVAEAHGEARVAKVVEVGRRVEPD